MATRREVLAAAAATVTLPMLNSALRSARAAASAPAGAPGKSPVPEEKAGWITTKLKVADIKDGDVTQVPDHYVLLVRKDKDITALSSRCTHRFAAIPAAKAGEKTLTCPWHGSQFNTDGSVVKGPATAPLPNFAIRTNADGFIEVDPGTKPKKEDKEFKITA